MVGLVPSISENEYVNSFLVMVYSSDDEMADADISTESGPCGSQYYCEKFTNLS